MPRGRPRRARSSRSAPTRATSPGCCSSGPRAPTRACGRSTPRRSPSSKQLDRDRDDLELVRATSHDGARADPAGRRGHRRRRPQLLDGRRGAAHRRRARGGRASCRCCSSTTSAGRTRAATTTSRPSRSRPSFRQPHGRGRRAVPGRAGRSRPGGLPYKWPAAREGGPRNGVLTAVEDFVEARARLRLAVVPGLLRLRRRLGRRRALRRRAGRAARAVGPQPAAGAARGQPRASTSPPRTSSSSRWRGCSKARPPGGDPAQAARVQAFTVAVA